MPLLDFNSLVICNDDFNINSLKSTLEFFSELGVKNFISTFPVDVVSDSPTFIKERIANLKSDISSIKPRGVKIAIAHNAHINPGVSHNPSLKSITYKHSKYLFIQTPLFIDDTWFSPDINYFLYKQKLLPIFTRFERTFISCDKQFSYKLYKIQKAVFCLDINYITSLNSFEFIKFGMANNITFIPSISNDISNYPAVMRQFQDFGKRLGTPTYLRFCKQINDNIKCLFNICSISNFTK